MKLEAPPRFFGNGINGNKKAAKKQAAKKETPRFFGNGINGNGLYTSLEASLTPLPVSSETELMETEVKTPPNHECDNSPFLRKRN